MSCVGEDEKQLFLNKAFYEFLDAVTRCAFRQQQGGRWESHLQTLHGDWFPP